MNIKTSYEEFPQMNANNLTPFTASDKYRNLFDSESDNKNNK